MVNPFSADFIRGQTQCGKCLCVTVNMERKKSEKEAHLIVFKSTSKMLCPVFTDFITPQVQGGECL
jgi:hypothetical protein